MIVAEPQKSLLRRAGAKAPLPGHSAHNGRFGSRGCSRCRAICFSTNSTAWALSDSTGHLLWTLVYVKDHEAFALQSSPRTRPDRRRHSVTKSRRKAPSFTGGRVSGLLYPPGMNEPGRRQEAYKAYTRFLWVATWPPFALEDGQVMTPIGASLRPPPPHCSSPAL